MARQIADNVFIAEGARLSGEDITIGKDSSVWYNAVIRSSGAPIRIGEKTNIQDGCVFHAEKGAPISVGDEVTIGHGAIIHGCTIKRGSLIGMGAIIMNGAVIGGGCLVGAGALVTEGTVVPDGSLVIGSPAKVKRALTEEEIRYCIHDAEMYWERAQEEKERTKG